MALLQTAKDLVASSLKDEGCIAYDIFESATRPDVLMICETWTDGSIIDCSRESTTFCSLGS